MITIGVAARQTGVAVDTLRKWSSRYGFPSPLRSSKGHRVFSDYEIEILKKVARNIAAGQKASQAISQALNSDPPPTAQSVTDTVVIHALAALTRNDLLAYEQLVEQTLQERGIKRFVAEFATPLAQQVGHQWQIGELPAFAEHAFASHMENAIARYCTTCTIQKHRISPHILLALPTGETHRLALLLLDALLREAGISTVVFRDPLPAGEIAQAARCYGVQIVALSCSQARTPRLLLAELDLLRRSLPTTVQLWAGGHGALRLAASGMAGIEIISSMEDAVQRITASLSA